MLRRTTAGKRYAEAVAGLAREAGSWQRWRDDLRIVAAAFEDPIVRLTLESPRVSPERKQSLLDSTIGDRVAPETRNLLRVMLRRDKIDLLPDVAQWFDEIADREEGIRRFTVTSAVPLSDEDRQRIEQVLAQRSGSCRVVLIERVDPDIIGGLVVQQDDIIHDYSVRARLQSLRERLN